MKGNYISSVPLSAASQHAAAAGVEAATVPVVFCKTPEAAAAKKREAVK